MQSLDSLYYRKQNVQKQPHSLLLVLCLFLWFNAAFAQISPGPLSEGHKQLEGLSNCTQCHSIGDKVPDNKCLDCHKEIDFLIKNKRGFHASTEVKAKTCIDCHSEHHGRKFDVDRFDEKNFNHQKTGYPLKGKHKAVDCRSCHKPDNIADAQIRKLEGTFLGMGTACLDCHDDYHQGTLSNSCTQCHSEEGWKPVTKFDHNKTDFPLKGAHQKVDCAQCHKTTERNGKNFQNFNIPFANCTDCHTDAHNGSFGTRCTDCHTETTWQSLKAGNTFNHDKTDFPLVGLHKYVDCKTCHKGESYTQPIAHNQCKSCHTDYHRGEFTRSNPKADCKDCHSQYKDFTFTFYSLNDHQQSTFKLEGGHAATPCFACHVSEDRWSFRNIGNRCVDCHDDIHKGKMPEMYYPNKECKSCHNTSSWPDINFEHRKTGYALEGKHSQIDCRACHYRDAQHQDVSSQQFVFSDNNCVQCHTNVHGNQFEKEGKTDCTSCHASATSWKRVIFDHNQTRFPLEGRHKEIDCSACHKPEKTDGTKEQVTYKIKRFECADCHSS